MITFAAARAAAAFAGLQAACLLLPALPNLAAIVLVVAQECRRKEPKP